MTHKLNQTDAHPIEDATSKSECGSGTSRRDFLSAAGALVVSVASGSLPIKNAQSAASSRGNVGASVRLLLSVPPWPPSATSSLL
jgi:hypothetical protein